jgi:ribosomal protein S18 acetylase RimI-like enzyme
MPRRYGRSVLTVGSPVGVRYLDVVTTLLQHRRLANPDGEVWEAADLQWWWPRHRHDDPADARVWYDGGEPIAATVLTRWKLDRFSCDVFAVDFEPAWTFAAERCGQLDVPHIEMQLPDDDAALGDAARRIGFEPSDDVYAVSWLDPADRREPRQALPDGYRIVARADDRTRPHPMIGRNGPQVEDGLRQCSLYDPELDLAVLAPDDTVAGYGLVWPDLVTGVGLVEPMRVEDAHAGQGLARHLIDAGLRGLTARGCTRLKVSVEPPNTPAVRLYAAAGFVTSRLDRTWVYARSAPG